jgi:hypothetical protein
MDIKRYEFYTNDVDRIGEGASYCVAALFFKGNLL